MMIFIVFFFLSLIALLFLFEVLLGSSSSVYNSEIGYESNFDQNEKMSNKEFFTKLIPFSIISICIPLGLCLFLSF